MRGRGSYRPVISLEKDIKIETKDEIQVIEDNNHYVLKKRKSLFNHSIDVITVSDEELDDDIQAIDSDYSSYSSGTGVSIIEEKPFRKQPKRCLHCRDVLTAVKVDTRGGHQYNSLTSADFYLNPRIHPSIIGTEMKDRKRFNCYEQSIRENKSQFKDKTVLVIGSGNGILALFSAQALAKTIIIYERPGIAELIEDIIERNRRKLPNIRTRFHVMRESLESMVLPNGLKEVDIIVSDWVNNSLFFRSLFKHVIKARDKWLRKGGLLFPDSAHISIVGAHDSIHKHSQKQKKYSNSVYVKRIDYWDSNLYGFDMTAVRKRVITEPYHDIIGGHQVITNECLVKRFDFYVISLNEINFKADFELIARKDCYLQTFVMFFDVIFGKTKTTPIMYSTRPSTGRTIFTPTSFFIEADKQLTLCDQNRVKGKFNYSLNENLDQLSVDIKYHLKNQFMDTNEHIFYQSFKNT